MQLDAIPETHLHELLEKVAADNGFTKPRFEVKAGANKGDNYLSLLYRATVSESDGDDKKSSKRLRLMCKATLQMHEYREALKLDRTFRNEANSYRMLALFADLMQEKGVIPQGSYYPEAPRCYLASVEGGGESDMIVLQDLSPEGFAMESRLRGVDALHTRAVLGGLARLHAASFACENLRPEEFQRLRDGMVEQLQDDCHMLLYFQPEAVAKVAHEAIVRRFPPESLEYRKAMEFCADSTGTITRAKTPCPEGGNTFRHMDCWTNNIMFKRDSEKPNSVPSLRFVDFQMSSYGSPAVDLIYFLYTCTDKSMRDAHLDDLLREYHEELQARMRALGIPDPDALFSWDVFQLHLKKYTSFGLLTALVLLPFFLAGGEEVADVEAPFKNGGEKVETAVVLAKDTSYRENRVCDVLEELIHRGYL